VKLGRNELCSCGSGKKYKRCCGQEAAVASTGSADQIAPPRQATGANSSLSDIQNSLGNAHVAQGRHEEAMACYRLALKMSPDDAKTHLNLGNVLGYLGRMQESIASSRRAIALDPNRCEAHNNLGLALAALGQFEEAVASYRRAVALNANYVDALNNLGNTLLDLGELREAAFMYERAVRLDPQRARSHRNLGNALFHLWWLDEAAASYRQALALEPGERAAHLALGMVLRLQGRPSEAEACCRAALAIEPNSAEALAFLAALHSDKGQFLEAQEADLRAIAIAPELPNAWAGIVSHRKMTQDDGAWLKGAQALVAKRLPIRHTISLRYALGKYFDDIKQYDQAFANYRQANELTKNYGSHYDASAHTQRVNRIIAGFDADSVRRLQSRAHPSDRPVFIVGMPRSGTSLTEQILASHPAVFGAGELTYWGGAFGTFEAAGLTSDIAADLIPGFAAAYLDRLAAYSKDALRVIDKMPENFMNLGMIHAAFPRARIIHMRRHPIDTCLSVYFQYLIINTHAYSNDFTDLAHYYGEYLRLMDHWRNTIPTEALLEIPYEGLIADQEGWSRRMVEFVGLPWDSKCLDFHKTERVVATSSNWQVRQKIHPASVGRFRNYEKFVEPLQGLVDNTQTDEQHH
jgi:tetratricopeptide (TPR) repeat protein